MRTSRPSSSIEPYAISSPSAQSILPVETSCFLASFQQFGNLRAIGVKSSGRLQQVVQQFGR
jgi:hypothetical protein